MHRPQKYRILLMILCFISFFSACEKEGPDCLQPNQVLLRVSFKAKAIDRLDTLIDSVLVDTTIIRYKDTFFNSPIMISIDMPQNVISFGSPNSNFLGIPLNPDSNRISYALQYDTTKNEFDTLTYFYHSSVHFISNACGFTHYYQLDSLQTTHHLIDSTVISQREVTDKASDRHINLYFFRQ